MILTVRLICFNCLKVYFPKLLNLLKARIDYISLMIKEHKFWGLLSE